MAIDLTTVTEVSTSPPDVEEETGARLSPDEFAKAKDVPPSVAPVEAAPLTGKEKAGVSLTWGVLTILAVFILLILVTIWIYESGVTLAHAMAEAKLDPATTTSNGQVLKEIVEQLELQRGSYRAFLKDIVQMVLLNVLLPVLTALLGYIFGTTQQANAAQSAEDG